MQRARKISPAQVLSAVKKGAASSLYYFYGQEDFQRDQLLNALIAALVEPEARPFNLDIYRAEEVEISQVISQVLTFPLMAPRRLVALKNADRLPDAATPELLPSLHPPRNNDIDRHGDQTRWAQKLYAELRKRAVAIEFRPPYDSEIPAWIQTHVKTLADKSRPMRRICST